MDMAVIKNVCGMVAQLIRKGTRYEKICKK